MIIKTENISKTFDNGFTKTEVLKNINLEINKGEFVSIMGPSGSGKSTLLYLLGNLDKPTSGSIFVNKKNIAEMKDKESSIYRRRDIGFVFQFYNLVQNLTVEENICIPLIFDGKKPKNFKKEIDEILELTNLTEQRNKYPAQLSGGQQQRVAIARALINKPEIIMADEPTGALDSTNSKIVMELFKKINKEREVTIIQVTHAEECAAFGNRVIKLKDGQIS